MRGLCAATASHARARRALGATYARLRRGLKGPGMGHARLMRRLFVTDARLMRRLAAPLAWLYLEFYYTISCHTIIEHLISHYSMTY